MSDKKQPAPIPATNRPVPVKRLENIVTRTDQPIDQPTDSRPAKVTTRKDFEPLNELHR